MTRKIPSFIKIYQSLIEIPTISSDNKLIDQSNKNFINLLSNYFSELKFSIKIQNIPHTNKFNMLASIGNGNGGLLLSGHTDTVNFDESLWTKNPFKLTQENNKLYGLGTTDMKSFFAFILNIMSSININRIKKPIHVLATANEETDMLGVRHFIRSNIIQPDYIIIGEPTSLKLITAHKGHVSYTLKVIGHAVHSSHPSQGINSIEIMNKIINKLIDLKKYFQQQYLHKEFSISYPTINFASIHGGNTINQVCSSCVLNFEIRPTPQLTLKKIEILIQDRLKKIIQKWPNRIFLKNLFFSIPAYKCSLEEKTINKIKHSCHLVSNTVNYCTEAPFLQKIAPTVILGPGSIKQAHCFDEYLDCSYILPTKRIFKKLIMQFCC